MVGLCMLAVYFLTSCVWKQLFPEFWQQKVLLVLLSSTDLIAEEGSAWFQVPTCGWYYELSNSDLLPVCSEKFGFVCWRNSYFFCDFFVHFSFLASYFVPPIPLDLLDMWKRTLGIWFLPLVTCNGFLD